jgi:glycosyltransferase involved in cell wall biosynthesis
MKRSVEVIFLGPYPPPVNGQSMAFKMAYDKYNGSKYLCSQNLEQLPIYKKIYFGILLIFRYFFLAVSKRYKVMYLAGSRSIGGAIKDFFSILLFHYTGSRVIMHLHAAFFDRFIHSIPIYLKPFFRLAYQKVDRFIVLHECMTEEYKEFQAKSQVSVVHNFYDSILDSVSLKDKPASDVIKIGYLSNLLFSKGIFILVEAFIELKKEYDNIELHLAGQYLSDSYMTADEVREKISVLSQNGFSRIFYHGPLYGEQKKNFLINMDIFCLPSFYSSEAMPISIMEAMRCGCVIITSDHHYLPFLVGPDQGSCATAGSVESLIVNLKRYLGNIEKYESVKEGNIEFAKNNFSPEAYTSKMNEIFDQELKSPYI